MGWVAAVIGVAAALVALYRSRRRFTVVDVFGSSMEPSMPSGERVLVKRIKLADVQHGDVVVVERPDRSDSWSTKAPSSRSSATRGRRRSWLVKRAVALPGDPVPAEFAATEETVPAGRLVVLGDSASAGIGSHSIGYVPADRVLGVVVKRLPPE
jgi:signal peptidase I